MLCTDIFDGICKTFYIVVFPFYHQFTIGILQNRLNVRPCQLSSTIFAGTE